MTTQTPRTKVRPRSRLDEIAKVDLIEVLDTGDEMVTTSVVNAVHWRRETYIPLRHGELRQRLAADERLAIEEKQQFLQLCKLLSATFHFEYHERSQSLKGQYEPFDPDAGKDEKPEATGLREDRQPRVQRLVDNLIDLLRRANYHKLSHDQIENAVAAASDWGVRLDVDFSLFERLEVYARGDVVGRRTRHRWRNLYRTEEVEVPIYQRLTVIFHLAPGAKHDGHLDPDAVYIKLFKNIPKEDVDMMLPGAKAKFSLFDKGAMAATTLVGVGVIFKQLWNQMVGVAALSVAGVMALWGVAVLLTPLCLRMLFGYRNTKNKYQLSLTRSLYFQNLDNSSGVLLRLTDEAEEQDFHEAILAYFLLWREAGEQGWTAPELDRAAEGYLQRLTNFGIDFEIEDSLQKLERLGLAQSLPNGRWRAAPLAAALAALDKTWDRFFDFA